MAEDRSSPPTEPAREPAAPGGLRDVPVTTALLAANAAVFALQVAIAGNARFAFGGGTPREAARWLTVLRWFGANDATFTIADSRFETLLTSCFLHGSILHLAFNLLVLWQVGPFLERTIGRARFLPLYLGAGIVGSAFSAIAGRLFGPSVSVGASGAICGLIAAILVLGARTQGWRGPLVRQMGFWLAFTFALGFARNLQESMARMDNAAHLGGAVGGAIIAATWQRGYTYSRKGQAVIVAASLAVVLASAGAVLARDRSDPYLFMDVNDRANAALSALREGRCDRATEAIRRALAMDPSNGQIRALAEQIDRDCAGAPTR